MPTHTHSTHSQMPGSRYSRRLHCIGRAWLSGVWLRYPKHLGVHAGAGVWAGAVGGRDVDCGKEGRWEDPAGSAFPLPHDPTGLRQGRS